MNLLKILSTVLVSGIFTLAAQSAWAVTDAAFAKTLRLNEAKLASIEKTLDGIKSKKTISLSDEGMDQAMYAYAESMKAAFDLAATEAKQASESKGRKGNPNLLGAFEKMALGHEVRTAKLEGKMKAIGDSVKKGDILLDKKLLKKMTPAERKDFKKDIQPGAILKYERTFPGLLGSNEGPTNPVLTEIRGVEVQADGQYCAGNSVAGAIGDFLMPTAEAAYAAPCVAVCAAKNWAGCVSCVVAAGSQAVQAWNGFVREWNGCCSCKWYKPWCCLCKPAALAKLIAKLA